jgi:hypothetical protein
MSISQAGFVLPETLFKDMYGVRNNWWYSWPGVTSLDMCWTMPWVFMQGSAGPALVQIHPSFPVIFPQKGPRDYFKSTATRKRHILCEHKIEPDKWPHNKPYWRPPFAPQNPLYVRVHPQKGLGSISVGLRYMPEKVEISDGGCQLKELLENWKFTDALHMSWGVTPPPPANLCHIPYVYFRQL